MTYAAENRHWLEPYIHDIAKRMNLDNWRITLSDDLPDEGFAAQCCIHGVGRSAKVLVRDPDGDLDDLRDSVVHELLHLHLHDTTEVLSHVEQHLNPPVYDIVYRTFWDRIEVSIHAIARAWSESMPLPVVKKKRA